MPKLKIVEPSPERPQDPLPPPAPRDAALARIDAMIAFLRAGHTLVTIICGGHSDPQWAFQVKLSPTSPHTCDGHGPTLDAAIESAVAHTVSTVERRAREMEALHERAALGRAALGPDFTLPPRDGGM